MTYTQISNEIKPVKYPKIFKAGDFVICLKDIKFADNTKHIKGHRYLVSISTEAYFNVNHIDYLKDSQN